MVCIQDISRAFSLIIVNGSDPALIFQRSCEDRGSATVYAHEMWEKNCAVFTISDDSATQVKSVLMALYAAYTTVSVAVILGTGTSKAVLKETVMPASVSQKRHHYYSSDYSKTI